MDVHYPYKVLPMHIYMQDILNTLTLNISFNFLLDCPGFIFCSYRRIFHRWIGHAFHFKTKVIYIIVGFPSTPSSSSLDFSHLMWVCALLPFTFHFSPQSKMSSLTLRSPLEPIFQFFYFKKNVSTMPLGRGEELLTLWYCVAPESILFLVNCTSR